MAKILEAKSVVDLQVDNLKKRVDALRLSGHAPVMNVILVGNNPASQVYVKNKKLLCEKVGAVCEVIKLPDDISAKDFVEKVKSVASDDNVDGCFVQLPLPNQLSLVNLPSLIPSKKDIDGFTAENFFKMVEGDKGESALLPCTPKGIINLLKYYKYSLESQNVVVIGRSMIVGKPMASLFTNYNATVTLCHSKTKDIRQFTKNADIIVVAIGRAKFFDKSFLSESKKQIIIDVGMNKDENGNLCGDVNFDDVVDYCEAITPVPGGVGRMTVLSLIDNLISATERRNKE
ncbi:MAG: bifunctional methylenetetrahydrofolate dehydrogenase/methenyltetrahydrofolate cyclohydrolase FolD [Bdellovibrio sp.]